MFKTMFCTVAVPLTLMSSAQPGGGYYRPDLNDSIIEKLKIGQSREEVTALLGTPHQRIRFDNLKSTAWDYRYRDSWHYEVIFSVMLGDDGRVVGKFSQRIDPVDKQ